MHLAIQEERHFCNNFDLEMHAQINLQDADCTNFGMTLLHHCFDRSQSHSFQRSSSIDHHAFYQNTSKSLCRRASQSTLWLLIRFTVHYMNTSSTFLLLCSPFKNDLCILYIHKKIKLANQLKSVISSYGQPGRLVLYSDQPDMSWAWD